MSSSSPFNRKDVYTLNLLIAAPEDASAEELSISLSSPEAIRFVRIPTVGEIAALTATEVLGHTISGFLGRS